LIENQLERTDHIHLGQVLTYAPRFDARAVVWVAREFTDAHRAALDWLNRITSEGYAFFGVEVRAVQIGDSIPAPLFDVVVKPNEWTRIAPEAAAEQGVLSDYSASNLAFWPPFHEALAAAGGPTRKAPKPLKDSNYGRHSPRMGAPISRRGARKARKPHVGVFLGLYNNGGAPQAWESLLARREELDCRSSVVHFSGNLIRKTRFSKLALSLSTRLSNPQIGPSSMHGWSRPCFASTRFFAEPVAQALATVEGET